MEKPLGVLELAVSEKVVHDVVCLMIFIHIVCHFLQHQAAEVILLGVNWDHLLEFIGEVHLVNHAAISSLELEHLR